jgi:hypothetical protein
MRDGEDGFVFELTPKSNKLTGFDERVVEIRDEVTGEKLKLFFSRKAGKLEVTYFDLGPNTQVKEWEGLPWEKDFVAPGLSLQKTRKLPLSKIRKMVDTREALIAWGKTWVGPAPNSLSPWLGEKLPLGTWRLDPLDGDYDVLVELPTDQIISGEPEDGVKFHESYKHYLLWARHGLEPPPITVVAHADDGRLVSIDRRRLLAAQEAGRKKIKAWFSETTPNGGPTWKLSKTEMQEVKDIWSEIQSGC